MLDGVLLKPKDEGKADQERCDGDDNDCHDLCPLTICDRSIETIDADNSKN